ncbi:MAG: hypothetical protein MI753_11735, partial [Hyphomicrobiales bacterium]|nr:hypothetical protein [Hyphomicrobiales bacterium]
LVLRDGRDCGEEYQAIESVVSTLKQENILPYSFSFEFAEYHKTSRKGLRIWDRNGESIDNALEGSYTILDEYQAVLNTTGNGTLMQGTASPLLIVGKYSPNMNINNVIEDIYLTSQLNFSSPSVAQRLTYPAKRVDDQLIERRAQEVERIK